jgi:nitrogen fixation protein
MPEPVANSQISVGDLVIARKYNNDRSSVANQEFTVTEIVDGVYKGGVIDCSLADGWELEFVNRPLDRLGLPSTLSEITLYDVNDTPTHVIGKGENWFTEDGKKMELWRVYRWADGHV